MSLTGRIAAISGLGSDNTCAHIMLSEATQDRPRPHIFLQESSEMLFPVAGKTPEELGHGLDALEQLIEQGHLSLAKAETKNFAEFKEQAGRCDR